MTAKADDDAGDGKSSFASLIEAGAQQMEDKIEHARMAMSLPKKSEEQKQETAMQAATKRAGIRSRKVEATRPLPAPTGAALRAKAHLDKVRMKAHRRLSDEGDDIDVEALIEAKMNNELDDANIFEKKKMEGGLDLLLLVDLSGSMHGTGVQMVEQALADVDFACSDQRVRLELWGFSDELFIFPKVGSPRDARGVSMCGTSMVQAIEVAQHWASSSKSSRAIVLMTDGLPTTCRAHDSTGDPNKDLANLLEEMRHDKVVLSVLAIGSKGLTQLYDNTFGAGNYGLVGGLPDMLEALPETCKVLVESHITRSCR
jgi:Mg-chelatase subunit ChlD